MDSKYQIVVHAEAWGEAQEHDLLKPMVEGTTENFEAIGDKEIFDRTRLTADSGFHNENNMEMLAEKEIDAYVADNQFRKRDPLFKDRDRYKERHRKERARIEGRSGLFKVDDFTFADDLAHAICPAGKKLYRSGTNIDDGKFLSHRFKGPKSACVPCKLRAQCLRKPDATEIRQVAFFHGRSEKGKNTFSEKMKRKIDSAVGKFIYSKRLGTVEPVFANICSTIGLDRFTMRGKTKVNSQWLMFCMLHNLKKIHRFGPGYA
ncbi:MAG: transposase [Desulfurivibrionaceae bacterium]